MGQEEGEGMVPLNQLTKETILSSKVLAEVFDQEDELYRAELLASLSMRATELKVKTEFREMVKAYRKVDSETKKKKQKTAMAENWTHFSDHKYEPMKCGQWIVTDEGVRLYDPQSGRQDVIACRHPIIPVRRMQNLQTEEEQVTLAFKRNGRWRELTIPKTTVTKASKICDLSARSILVTSESAKLLVRYLADVEADNEENIPVILSSSKMGWIRGKFLPYDTGIEFDGAARFRQIYESIQGHGSREKWYQRVLELRKKRCFEIQFMMAASFASVLISIIGGLPFMVDLWGQTEGGKSVTLLLATSIWANPNKGMYYRDYASTDVGFEALADFLNHLPVVLDDTSKRCQSVEKRFEEIIYNLCSGKGKTRSNKELGINRENVWECITLTNGEKPITSYVSQGGAINRVLEVEAGEHFFPDPQGTMDTIKHNYGFAGMDFIDVLKDMGKEEICRIQKELQAELMNDDKMQKQAISLSIVLTADKIATERLFKDGEYISVDKAKEVLVDRNELSDNERCYRFILDKVNMNEHRFDATTKCEKWGMIQKGYALIFNAAFDELCREGEFSKKSFLSWANRKGLLQTQGGQMTKNKKVGGSTVRCVWLRIEEEPEFVPVENEQMEIPFD